MNESRKLEISDKSVSLSLSVCVFAISVAVAGANLAFRLTAIEQAEREDRRQLHEVKIEQQRRTRNVYVIDNIKSEIKKLDGRINRLEDDVYGRRRKKKP